MNIEVDTINGDAILEIFSMNGELIFNRNYINVQVIQERLRKNELFPSPGIYFVRLTTGENVFVKKITVL